MDSDAARVVHVLTGSFTGACGCDCAGLKALKAKAMERLDVVMRTADASTSVGDESWDVSRFFDATMRLIDWIDRKCDQAEPLGYVQSEGPTCGGGGSCRW